MSHKKFGADRFSRFDVYWIQTNKQTNRHPDRQAKFIYRLKSNCYRNFLTSPRILFKAVSRTFCFRGFETVSYLLEGEFHHEDFAGHKVLFSRRIKQTN